MSEGSKLCRDSISIRVVTDLEIWVEPIHYCQFILMEKIPISIVLLVCSKCKKRVEYFQIERMRTMCRNRNNRCYLW